MLRGKISKTLKKNLQWHAEYARPNLLLQICRNEHKYKILECYPLYGRTEYSQQTLAVHKIRVFPFTYNPFKFHLIMTKSVAL